MPRTSSASLKVALIAVVALFFTGLIPTEPVGQMIKGLAAEDSDQALDRLRRAGLCHLGFLSMKLILVVRSVSIVMALNWATVLRAVTAAKPTASASANLIMP